MNVEWKLSQTLTIPPPPMGWELGTWPNSQLSALLLQSRLTSLQSLGYTLVYPLGFTQVHSGSVCSLVWEWLRCHVSWVHLDSLWFILDHLGTFEHTRIQKGSFWFIWVQSDLLKFTRVHLGSDSFTWFTRYYSSSLWFTRVHLGSLMVSQVYLELPWGSFVFTWVHASSFCLTLLYLGSLRLTSVHLGSLGLIWVSLWVYSEFTWVNSGLLTFTQFQSCSLVFLVFTRVFSSSLSFTCVHARFSQLHSVKLGFQSGSLGLGVTRYHSCSLMFT